MIVDDGEVIRTNVRVVRVKVLKMTLLHHRCLVDVEGDRDPVVVRNLRKLLHVLDVCAADVGIEKYGVPVAVLVLYKVIEIRVDVLQGFRQPWLFLYCVDGEIDGRDPSVS